jgi:hypothetical protein
MKRNIFIICMMVTFLVASPVSADILRGTYEVSYIYNSMNGTPAPGNALWYYDGYTAPLLADLGGGEYYWKIVDGRVTGNKAYSIMFNQDYSEPIVTLNNVWQLLGRTNPYGPNYYAGENYHYETGFNGGATDPYNYVPPAGIDPGADPQTWWKGFYLWVGESTTNGNQMQGTNFSIPEGQKAWLYWNDNWANDNLGGATVEIWQKSTESVPEPATMLLLGFGILGLAGVRRFRR